MDMGTKASFFQKPYLLVRQNITQVTSISYAKSIKIKSISAVFSFRKGNIASATRSGIWRKAVAQ